MRKRGYKGYVVFHGILPEKDEYGGNSDFSQKMLNLCVQSKCGDRETFLKNREKFIVSHIRYALSIVSNFSRFKSIEEDLVGKSMEMLIVSVDKLISMEHHENVLGYIHKSIYGRCVDLINAWKGKYPKTIERVFSKTPFFEEERPFYDSYDDMIIRDYIESTKYVLSRRERDLINFTMSGLSSEEIRRKFGLTKQGVSIIRTRMKHKFLSIIEK